MTVGREAISSSVVEMLLSASKIGNSKFRRFLANLESGLLQLEALALSDVAEGGKVLSVWVPELLGVKEAVAGLTTPNEETDETLKLQIM